MSFKITTISAYISEDENGEEGVIGERVGGVFMPFVMADETRLKAIRPYAERIARILKPKKKVKLVRFSVREDLEIL